MISFQNTIKTIVNQALIYNANISIHTLIKKNERRIITVLSSGETTTSFSISFSATEAMTPDEYKRVCLYHSKNKFLNDKPHTNELELLNDYVQLIQESAAA